MYILGRRVSENSARGNASAFHARDIFYCVTLLRESVISHVEPYRGRFTYSHLYKQYIYIPSHISQPLVSEEARFHVFHRISVPSLKYSRFVNSPQLFISRRYLCYLADKPKDEGRVDIPGRRVRRALPTPPFRFAFARYAPTPVFPKNEGVECRMQRRALAESTLTQPHGYITRIAATN